MTQAEQKNAERENLKEAREKVRARGIIELSDGIGKSLLPETE